MTARQPINVLFLCTGNSARSILCETALNSIGKERFKGFRADSQPKDEVHPMTRKRLKDAASLQKVVVQRVGRVSWRICTGDGNCGDSLR